MSRVFEWDDAKSQENAAKHGVACADAVAMWDASRIDIDNIAHAVGGETRSATVGWIGGIVYTAIWTRRGRSIRLISVRRARTYEEKIFHEKIQNHG